MITRSAGELRIGDRQPSLENHNLAKLIEALRS
jgi:hypothetical protein